MLAIKYIWEIVVFALSENTDITEVSRVELTVMVEHLTVQTQLACQSDAAKQNMAGFYQINICMSAILRLRGLAFAFTPPELIIIIMKHRLPFTLRLLGQYSNPYVPIAQNEFAVLPSEYTESEWLKEP